MRVAQRLLTDQSLLRAADLGMPMRIATQSIRLRKGDSMLRAKFSVKTFLLVILIVAFAVVPLIGKNYGSSTVLGSAADWCARITFPIQIFAFIYLLFALLGFGLFWTSYSIYLLILGLFTWCAVKREVTLVCVRTLVVYLIVAGSLYVLIEAMFYYLAMNFLNVLPAQPLPA